METPILEKQTTACFTGHRKLPYARYRVHDPLLEALEQAIAQGYTTFLCGGAVGFDQMAGWMVVNLKEFYPSLRLVMVLPCLPKLQCSRWKPGEQQNYYDLLEAADATIVLSNRADAGAMFLRNRYMVDHSSFCIAWQEHEKGGTAYTTGYAKKQGVDVYNVAKFNI